MAAKYEQLAAILHSELQQLLRRGETKLPTEAELAARYHMSRQTVRHALGVLEEKGLIRRRQGSGSFILPPDQAGDLRQIAVITTFLDDYTFPSILHDAQSAFAAAGYSTLIFATENQVSREREILAHLLSRKVSALLVEGTKTALPTPNDDLYLLFRQRGIPVLFLQGQYGNLPDFPCLADDNFHGGYTLVQHLLSRGRTRIAGIFKSDDIQGLQRYHGMAAALRDRGIPLSDDAILWYNTRDREALVSGQACPLLDAFLREQLAEPTGVICFNDEIAHILIQRLLAAGKRIPEDVAVASFDNSYYSRIGPVPITSLGHRNSRTGKAAAQLLLDILDGTPERSVCLEWELAVRSST